MVPPEGVKGVWDLSTAEREATSTRERISLKGMWQWQPAAPEANAVPADGWGYVQVPSAWPGGSRRGGSGAFYPHPSWQNRPLQDVMAAWYQIGIPVPAGWAGRRIALNVEFLNSFATVYVDGRKAGDMRFPGGELDLTSLCQPGRKHVLSLLVLAMPLKAVVMSFNDTDAARQVRGQVGRRGLCGDVFLVGAPRNARIGDVRVVTSVRKWQMTLDTALDGVDPQATYRLRGQVRDGDRTVKDFTSRPFRGADLSNARIAVSEDWHPDKLWDLDTPHNQYDVSVSLLTAEGRLLDEALPERFGFREFWIDGRYFYLNGTRIFLSFCRSQPGWTYDAARERMERLRQVGINLHAVGGFGCEPGAHQSFKEVLRAADDVGVLIALTQPHFGQYDWDAPDADVSNGYAQHAAFYTRIAGNHPSVVFYATSHNGTGYSEDMNPDLIDGLVDRSPWSRGSNVPHALRAQAIVERLDPTRILYHHSSGNLGTMHTCNFYANWVPIQEMSDWFEHWGTVGVKPMHTCEYAVPCTWDWSMYRGWYKGRREFGSAEVPWEFCLAGWDAQFQGAEAYKIGEPEAANLRWEAERFRKGELWQRWDYPYQLNFVHPGQDRVLAQYFSECWRAFRTWGLSVNAPEQYEGPLSTAALVRNNGPLLAYIGGKPAAFATKDHNFLPGETVQKQLIIINNCRKTVTADCQWSFALPNAVTGTKTVTLPTGEQERIPLTFELPPNVAPGQYVISATIGFSNGETQKDTFLIDVLPAPLRVEAGGQIALFDPKGETAKLLDGMGIRYHTVDAGANLAAYDTLIVGKAALTLDGPAPDVSRVRDGLKVVIFEQTAAVLEKRFGFRTTEYGLRQVFKRVPDHPILAGVADEHLCNWRGDSTILPPRLEYELSEQFGSPTVQWCGIPVTRLWRCGNRGNVASALIEKPACGDFLSILDGGYALQYTSLMEHRDGKGMVLFCQTDVSGRTESDPAAEALARNIIRYVSDWKPAPRRTVVYVGDEAGKKYLEAAGVAVAAYEAGTLSPDKVLVVGPGGGQQLAAGAAAVARFLVDGGRVLAIGLSEEEANAFLPVKVKMKAAEHIAAYFEPQGVGSPLAGVSPAEVHNRDPRKVPLVTEGAKPVGDGVLATAEDGRLVFWQLAPWEFDYSGEKMNIKRTFRRVSCGTARLLGNLGAGGETPVLARFSSPVAEGEKRWLKGLYLDVPEEWDDPYRFFRW
jgi:beta-galactosidase